MKENKYLFFDREVKISLKNAIKNILYIPRYILYKLYLRLFVGKDIRECKYYFSVCAIFKNEGTYLKEWIEYHILLGTDHFYLYNNNSTDNYKEILSEYINNGYVTLIDWPEIPGQLSAYKHWYDNYRDDTNWVSFIDIDEFVCPRRSRTIKEWLDSYSIYPVIVMYWRFFCSSGLIEHDEQKTVIEQYFTCYEKPLNIGKVIYNTRFDIEPFKMSMWHSTSVKVTGLSIPPINDQGHFIMWDIHLVTNSSHSLLLNHYWSKSYMSLMEKKGKGASAFATTYITDEWFWRNDSKCIDTDFTIYRFLLPLKLKLKG